MSEYSAPALTVVGSLHELTLMGPSGPVKAATHLDGHGHAVTGFINVS